ncbi:MAG: DegT/DnrJ/EryC1/StrS family aminotransferase [Candidatus Eisenbacteria bacterium]|nr:DegT/DnrJ/EryC1/StrS family aminotransferase [Candidatus Eisenbacteria bacterium]
MGGNPARKTFLPFARPCFDDKERAEVLDALGSDWITTGPKTLKFEKELAAYVGSRYAVALNSCTAALHLALASYGIGEGDEVITSPFTFCSTVAVILHMRAKPVLADVDERTFNIDPEEVKKKLTRRTKAIIPVHFAGQPCEMDSLLRIAQQKGVKIIEDAAHAIGAEYKGRKIGSIGDATAFSFYATKNLTTGEGGMLVTDDEELSEKVRILSLHGMSRDAWKRYFAQGSWYYEITQLGYKCNMSDIMAAIGIHQLRKLDSFVAKREKYASYLDRAIARIGHVTVPYVSADLRHARHIYPLLLNLDELSVDRTKFIEELRSENIGTTVHFIPIHYHPYFRDALGYKKGDFPKTEALYEREISLPLYPSMTKKDLDDVVSAIGKIVGAYGKK